MNLRRTPQSRPARRGLSLIEVLMAVFILGVGVISIAAVLPAGIAQQQRSTDDVLGPIVADTALSLIRAKLEPEDFGFLDARNSGYPLGDWPWLRPAYVAPGATTAMPDGGIDVFNYTELVDGTPVASEFTSGRINQLVGATGPSPYDLPLDFITAQCGDLPDGAGKARAGIPSLAVNQGCLPPPVRFAMAERVYPVGDLERPQFVWDCMFRRSQGRIEVAIFVYRVRSPGGQPRAYRVAPSAVDANVPPIPWSVIVPDPWDALDDTSFLPKREIDGTGGTDFDPYDPNEQWKVANQWIVDQHGQLHRVLFGRRAANDGNGLVTLAQPVAEIAPTGGAVFPGSVDDLGRPGFSNPNGLADTDVVDTIWYVPSTDASGFDLIPVYALVREL